MQNSCATRRFWSGLVLAMVTGSAMAGPAGCDLPRELGAREVQQTLSLRAVELVRRAGDPKDRLTTLVDSSATFSLGAGDVGRPFAKGAKGARELASTMHADTYRFLGWNYMNYPQDACAAHKVEVEFIDSRSNSVSSVEFSFEAGRVVGAAGWERSFETGPIAKEPGT